MDRHEIGNTAHWSAYDFKELVAEKLRQAGCTVSQTQTIWSNDTAKDGTFQWQGQTYVYKCRHTSKKISRQEISILHAAMTLEGAAGAYFFASSEFTPPAREYADKIGIRLYDSQMLQSGNILMPLLSGTTSRQANPARLIHTNSVDIHIRKARDWARRSWARVSKNGRYAVHFIEGHLHVYSAKTGNKLTILRSDGEIRGFDQSPDGRMIAAIYRDTILIWRTGGWEKRVLKAPWIQDATGIRFSSTSSTLICWLTKNRIVVLRVVEGNVVWSKNIASECGAAAAVSTDHIAMSLSNGGVELFKSSDGALVHRWDDYRPVALRLSEGPFRMLARIQHDGKHLRDDVWAGDFKSGFSTPGIGCLSPDGSRYCYSWVPSEPGLVILQDLNSNAAVSRIRLAASLSTIFYNLKGSVIILGLAHGKTQHFECWDAHLQRGDKFLHVSSGQALQWNGLDDGGFITQEYEASRKGDTYTLHLKRYEPT